MRSLSIFVVALIVCLSCLSAAEGTKTFRGWPWPKPDKCCSWKKPVCACGGCVSRRTAAVIKCKPPPDWDGDCCADEPPPPPAKCCTKKEPVCFCGDCVTKKFSETHACKPSPDWDGDCCPDEPPPPKGDPCCPKDKPACLCGNECATFDVVARSLCALPLGPGCCTDKPPKVDKCCTKDKPKCQCATTGNPGFCTEENVFLRCPTSPGATCCKDDVDDIDDIDECCTKERPNCVCATLNNPGNCVDDKTAALIKCPSILGGTCCKKKERPDPVPLPHA